MQKRRNRIQFPPIAAHKMEQDEVFFYLVEGKDKKRIRFHDYDEIYKIPDLYEQVFYDRLKCNSPFKVTEILKSAIDQTCENFTEIRVLDFGAGNGMMGEALKRHGVSRLVGADILPEAKMAAERDRPDLYDAYYVFDFCKLKTEEEEELKSWNLNCFTIVAALGFGDIPTDAFMAAFNIIQAKGWVAFNIKETFLDESDRSGFSRMIREMIFSEYLDIYHLERYRHRLSMEGEPLYYYALAGRKNADIADDLIERFKSLK
ncbi:MAG: methyltransferase [bacterium]|nr:methyltransferase [bacterium]